MLAGMRTFLIFCLAASASSAQDAAALFTKHCAGCHTAGDEIRAPRPSALKLLSKEKILAALEAGTMKSQGAALTSAERLALRAWKRNRKAELALLQSFPFPRGKQAGPDGAWTWRTADSNPPKRRASTGKRSLDLN